MASSKVMASSSSANSDLARQSSIYSLTVSELQNDQSKNFGSMNMDELLKNIYGDNPSAAEIIPNAAAGASNEDGESNGGIPNVGNKSVEEVWKDIVASAGGGSVDRKVRGVSDVQFYKDTPYEEMTLEDFLAKAGAVREEDVRATQAAGPVQGVFPSDPMLSNRFQQQQQQQQQRQQQQAQQQPQQPQIDGSIVAFGNGVEGTGVIRGKRRVVDEPVDKVAQQRQRRMIKNRESAARSRERKQAYTVELESLVSQLEEENARLLKEQVLQFSSI
ncbi:ABSCISIC ACID-INSENSITIVE 5-like protein 5 [Macadamia integrifolia]|uniref:ABSCISIC ACID-INSENSITIVE 5-like protein 5 n=1 Tax=Macadamia integrifolia TaxID=60698 RepID=UPI001C5333DE|nr:ABSCISIC ACID-INSENSITIVE 5-like protein 5 [Macadamia integrifolia]